MSWDETLFGWMWRGGRALLRPREAPEVLARRVSLADLQARLTSIVIATAGASVVVREAEGEGGLAPGVVLLPRVLDFAPTREQNERAYVVRAALAGAILRRGLVVASPELSAVERALATVIAVQCGRAALVDELPASAEALDTLCAYALASRSALPAAPLEQVLRVSLGDVSEIDSLAHRVMAARPATRTALVEAARQFAAELSPKALPPAVPLWGWLAIRPATLQLTDAGPDPKALPHGTERAMRPRDHVVSKSLDKRELSENPLIHSFEKLHTLEEHSGGKKPTDGSDELEAHAEALDELDLREVIRSNEETRSLMRCDAMLGGGGDRLGDVREGGLPYDEWNQSTRAFRPAWCHVHVSTVQERVDPHVAEAAIASATREARSRIDAVRAEIARLESARRPRARQLDGPDVDDDAMVERHASLAAGTTPPDRLYRSRRRHSPDLAVLVLLDASLSSDGWVDGTRILDAERDATLVLAEALSGVIDELGVAAFTSHTRADCRFAVVKGMNEAWSSARRRISSVEPSGYTRIGPALRHATTVLERTASRRRLLLVVTDGKPNDFDRYEGTYGVSDVAHATLEARGRGIVVHALAVDRSARDQLPKMFGAAGFTLLRDPAELARAMGDVVTAMQR